jgi:hypothetical protein
MSKHYKPQLKHVGFDWPKWTEEFCRDLRSVHEEICDILGFYKEHGTIGEYGGKFDDNIALERHRLIEEIAGILSKAAAMAVDGGFASTNQSIATLRRIKKKPSLISEKLPKIDPAALAELASQYQRADEKPSTFSSDLFAAIGEPNLIAEPTASNISDAAERAINQLQGNATVGRPENPINELLAKDLGSIFIRYNKYVGRSSVIGHDLHAKQIEIGRFTEFLKLVTSPLSRFLRIVSKPTVSIAKVARSSAKRFGNPTKRKSAK